jgi:hypothetical protein
VLCTICDLTICSEKAIFGQVGPKMGSVDPGYGTAFLARVVGEKKAREIWYMCRRYAGAEAVAMGLANACVPHDQLDAEVQKWGEELCERSPTALATARSINDELDACAAACPDKLALTAVQVEAGLTSRFTCGELVRMADRIAAGLARLGVGRNDIVACQLPNWWQFTLAYLACSRIGAVMNPLMHIFRERELSFMLKHGAAKVVVPQAFRGFDFEQMVTGLQPQPARVEARRGGRRCGCQQFRVPAQRSGLGGRSRRTRHPDAQPARSRRREPVERFGTKPALLMKSGPPTVRAAPFLVLMRAAVA